MNLKFSKNLSKFKCSVSEFQNLIIYIFLTSDNLYLNLERFLLNLSSFLNLSIYF